MWPISVLTENFRSILPLTLAVSRANTFFTFRPMYACCVTVCERISEQTIDDELSVLCSQLSIKVRLTAVLSLVTASQIINVQYQCLVVLSVHVHPVFIVTSMFIFTCLL